MDRRAIDWTASARHLKLFAREYRVERDNRVVLAIDGGRTMAEPVGGLPRVERAVSAALLLAYAGLKPGDRNSLFRSEERRVGKECVSTYRSRWLAHTYKKKQHQLNITRTN